MPILCNREAFKLDDGCPPVDVDLEFPDFDSCLYADSSRLKGVSNVGVRKTPVFPMFIPPAEQIPPDVPDLSDLMCILGTVDGSGNGLFPSHGLKVDNPFGVDESALTVIVPIAGFGLAAVTGAMGAAASEE